MSSPSTRSSTPTPALAGSRTQPAAGTSSTEQTASNGIDPSVFDVLNSLRRRLYVSREMLVSELTLASKNQSGSFDRLTLTPEFHSVMMKKALFTILDGARRPDLVQKIKSCLFVYLLEVMNGGADQTFLDLASGATSSNRADRERRRE